ncbi:hypothetical protein ACFPM7_22870 [Actinokineospora guangxiensis]|uniref:Uncharacterized protein n=1 Tax=Actinokineospora guangxiensis TaxID=1490288 RepID=A0ABW0EU18_9PSEU
MIERWESLQARLFHLGYLGEELEAVAACPDLGGWLYRQVADEAAKVARVAEAYADAYESAAAYYADAEAVVWWGSGDAR